MADPCYDCGTDSVATCPSCNRRVCNRHMVISASVADSSLGIAITGSLNTAVRLVHPVGDSFVNQKEGPFLDGYMSGSSRCFECRQRDGHAAAESDANRVKQEAKEYGEAVRGLEAASDPAEIARLIRQGGYRLSTSDCRGAWQRLARSGALGEYEHEIVTVRISHRKFWGNPAVEQSRNPAWRYRSSRRSPKDLLLIAADGNRWRDDGMPGISRKVVLPSYSGDTSDVVAISRGSEVQMHCRRGAPGWTLEAGLPILEETDEDFSEAVLSVIEQHGAPSAAH